MKELKLLTDEELAAAIRNRRQAEASFAIEGIHLSDEEKALFDRFERERLPHDECLRQAIEYCRAKREEKAGTPQK